MLDKLLKRNDVCHFIEEIQTNERYYVKNSENLVDSSFSLSQEIALFIFYDALLKYKMIVNDIYLFDEYLEQLEKLYRKLDDFSNIRRGVHQLIVRMIATKLSISDVEQLEARNQILTFVYDRYLINGYFIHGFSSSYFDSLQDKDFEVDSYENYYDRFQKINSIFEKYNVSNVLSKDFSSRKIYLTDDFVMGCYYSMYTPMFYYEFLTNPIFGKKIPKEDYLENDYETISGYLKRYMSNNLFNEVDRRQVMDLVKDEWDLLHRSRRRITLLLVKRNSVFHKKVELEEFLKDSNSIYEVVDRMLSSKYNAIMKQDNIKKENIEFLSFDYIISKNEEVSFEQLEEEEYYKNKEEEVNQEFLNKYGSVSILLLLGSLFVSLGVIITIITILRG